MTPVFAFVTGPEILIVGAIILVLFGADRLPKLARSLGQAKKEFEAGVHASPAPPAAETPAAPQPPAETAPPSAPQAPPPPPSPS